MGLETATYISQLNPANPPGGDLLAQADDHIRLNKSTAQNTFAGFAGAVIVTGTDTGAADAYVLTPATALPSYVSGMLCIFTPTNVNTGAATVNISGLGVKSIKKTTGAALAAGDLPVSYPSLMQYNGTDFILIGGAGLAMKSYVDALVFSPVLPGQATHAGGVVTTDGTNASWADLATQAEMEAGVATGTRAMSPLRVGQAITALAPRGGLTLLATLTPTAAAAVDALTTFTSSYDNYLIIGEGLKPSSDDTPALRFANAGTADAGSNYYRGSGDSDTAVTAATTSAFIGQLASSAGIGVNFVVHVLNANDATRLKSLSSKAMSQSDATPGFTMTSRHAVYKATNAVSGVRFLWAGGNNFAAVGKIRIYGYSNT